MSWDMWHIWGIGFDVADVDVNKYRQFVVNHKTCLDEKKDYRDFLGYILDTAPEDLELTEVLDSINSLRLADPIAEIMTSETGIRFDAPGISDDDYDCVLFTAAYPWQWNETERSLTEDQLYETMKRYAEELGVEAPGEYDLVYSG